MTNNNLLHSTCFNCAALEFDLELGVVKNAEGESQRLSPINLKLLAYLVSHRGEVISRTTLFDAIWPNQTIGDDVLTRAVSDIRTQLAKLDGNSKFIETLPKRGYRWALEISEQTPRLPPVAAVTNNPRIPPAIQIIPSRTRFVRGLAYVGLSVLLALAFMGWISQSMRHQMSIAVLPTLSDRPQTDLMAKDVHENILLVVRKNPQFKLLSSSAIASRPQNPFPYFFKEFGATWVLESRVSDLDGITSIALILVDARTGVELRNLKVDVNNRAEAAQKVAQKLEFDLLVDQSPY
jgi:DNA-binding winged helix-turn-helix (wHTH) protein/TolB-like protein